MMINQTSFQDATSASMKALIEFHDQAMTILILIMAYVTWVVINSLFFFSYSTEPPYEGHEMESIWTLLPSIILVMLAMPSLHLLYMIEEINNEQEWDTLKVVGHQWYWEYEIFNDLSLSFNSYMLPPWELEMGEFRLLEVDNRVMIPWGWSTRIFVTAADVLHSWAIPSLGIKVDAVPGRLNKAYINPKMPGVFYGQCSEICGAGHSFMPIVIETTPWWYVEWDQMSSTETA